MPIEMFGTKLFGNENEMDTLDTRIDHARKQMAKLESYYGFEKACQMPAWLSLHKEKMLLFEQSFAAAGIISFPPYVF